MKDAQASWETKPELTNLLGVAETLAWLQQNRVFSRIGAYEWQQANLTGGSAAERIDCEQVSGSFLSVLGLHPVLGRGFLPGEDHPGAP